MVSRKKSEKKVSILATYGVALSSLFVDTTLNADIFDITYNGGFAATSILQGYGPNGSQGPAVLLDIDQVGNNVDFCVVNSFAIATSNPPFRSFKVLNSVAEVAGLKAGDMLDPSTFSGSPDIHFISSYYNKPKYNIPVPSYIGFQTIGGNVGWFKLDIDILETMIMSDGEFGTEGETLFAGGILLGDVNLDGLVNLLDVEPFIDHLSTGVYLVEADMNQDGAVNLLDVEPFVEALSGN